MSNPLTDVPWGNLWRWVVSTMLFVLVIGLPIALLTNVDNGPAASLFTNAVIVIAAIVAAIVVWSEDVPWPGDPE